MICFKDKTFCALPNCQDKCGRKMNEKEKEELKDWAFRGLKPSVMISSDYFCDKNGDLIKDD